MRVTNYFAQIAKGVRAMINHNARYEVVSDDIVKWAKAYEGLKFHACIADWTYNLSIDERFGKAGAKPAKPGKDGQFARLSAGFMHQAWDTEIGYLPETWESIMPLVEDGGYLVGYSHPRRADLMQAALREAGATIGQTWYNYHNGAVLGVPPLLGWAFGTGSPRNTLADKAGSEFTDFVYGITPLKPQLEPIVVAQNPFGKRRLDSIVNGAGVVNIPLTRPMLGKYPGHVTATHHPLCKFLGVRIKPKKNAKGERIHEYDCHKDCMVKAYEESGGLPQQLWQADWVFEIAETLDYLAPIQYMPKPTKKEREAGLENLEPIVQARLNPGGLSREKRWGPKEKRNNHPTVKPIKLNIWLYSIFLPPPSVGVRRVLIPCSGSGSEMIGALLAGWDEVIGVELDPSGRYQTISNMRLEFWTQAMRMFPDTHDPFKLVDLVLKKQNYDQVLKLISLKEDMPKMRQAAF